MEELEGILISRFSPITLDEMDGVGLLDRVDTKFVFCSGMLLPILEELFNDYRVLEVKGKRISRYDTTYLDTPLLDTYMLHQHGKLNRYKIRFRRYVETGQVYLETKFKNNKSRAIKTRVKVKSPELQHAGIRETQLLSRTPYDMSELKPSLNIRYNRVTLVHKNHSERLTIDTDLQFVADTNSKGFPNLVIAEVKQDKNKKSEFIQIMHRLHIRQMSVSKYCLGISCLYPDVKKNTMKYKLLTINKLCHEHK